MFVNAAAALLPTPETQSAIEQHTPRQYQTELFLEARKRNVRPNSAFILQFVAVALVQQQRALLHSHVLDCLVRLCRSLRI